MRFFKQVSKVIHLIKKEMHYFRSKHLLPHQKLRVEKYEVESWKKCTDLGAICYDRT
jgi:hypothetical protein